MLLGEVPMGQSFLFYDDNLLLSNAASSILRTSSHSPDAGHREVLSISILQARDLPIQLRTCL